MTYTVITHDVTTANSATRRRRVRTVVSFVVFAAVVLAGCVSSRSEPSGTATSATDPLAALSVDELAAQFSAEPTSEAARTFVASVAAAGDSRYSAHLLDLVRIGYSSAAAEEALDALAELSGIPRTNAQVEDYLTYGQWVLEAAPTPPPDYPAFKAAIYRQVDNDFVPLLTQVEDLRVLAALQWGGVGVGAIMELNEPARLAMIDVAWSTPDEEVFGIVGAQGTALAYPERIIARHELANDMLDGTAVAVSFCTLCRAARVFDRRVAGRTLSFKTSGLLLNSNKVMVDNETGTLWQQLTGKAVAGPLTGSRLVELPVETTSWSQWQLRHPASATLELPKPSVIDGETGVPIGYDYVPGAALAPYFASEQLWYPVLATPDVLPLKEEVATVTHNGAYLAVSVEALARRGERVRFDVGGRQIVAVSVPQSVRFEDAASGEVLASSQSFWFAWYGEHPDTQVWPPEG